ncbi:MAG: hypothetical protein KIT79_11715 [Deltaproteobacteria bacterium]|nr:hypothetical protein [Deltaproteobacteria bacterium]
MGVDFLRNKTRSFAKSWDRARLRLGTPDLFSIQPEHQPTTVVADLTVKNIPSKLDNVLVRANPDHIGIYVGNEEIGQLVEPSQEILEAIRAGCGIAQGHVEQINPLSRTVEIAIR